MPTLEETKTQAEQRAKAREWFAQMSSQQQADAQRPRKHKRPQVGDREVIGCFADVPEVHASFTQPEAEQARTA